MVIAVRNLTSLNSMEKLTWREINGLKSGAHLKRRPGRVRRLRNQSEQIKSNDKNNT